MGSIAGHTSSGAEVLFPQLVYAINTSGACHGAYSTETNWSQTNFTITGIPPGAYYVYATNRPVQAPVHGSVNGTLYSVAIKCGFAASCTNHNPLKVTVKAGVTTANIDPGDYPADGAFVPAPPDWIVPPVPPVPPAASGYASARAAAVAAVAGSNRNVTLVVDNMTACPVNRACTAVGTEHDGTEAAYFIGVAGSNRDLIACGTYVIHVPVGWQPLGQACGWPTVFPAVGQSGAVQLGFENRAPGDCANVRAVPGPGGKVVACLADGTLVRLNAGPVYAPMASSNGLWWHIAGRGWMVDDYLGHHFVGP